MDNLTFLKKFIGEHNFDKLKEDNKTLTDDVIKKMTSDTLQIIQNSVEKFVLLYDQNYAKINFMTYLKDKTRESKLPLSSELLEIITGRLYGIFAKKNNIDSSFIKTYINILLESINVEGNISIDPNDFDFLAKDTFEISQRPEIERPIN